VIATQQEDLAGILKLKREEKAENLQTLTSTIYVVAQEDVVEGANITGLLGGLPDVEEAHQVVVVTVEVSEDLDGWLEVLDEHGLGVEHLGDLADELKHLLLLDVEGPHQRDGDLTLSWGKQIFDEERVKRLVVVLLNQRGLHVRSELAGLLLQLVNRDLADHQREVFSWRLHLAALSVQTHRDMGLIGEAEFLCLNDVVDVLVLADGILGASVFARLGRLRVHLGGETRVVSEQLRGVNLRDRVDRNVRSLMLKATVYVN